MSVFEKLAQLCKAANFNEVPTPKKEEPGEAPTQGNAPAQGNTPAQDAAPAQDNTVAAEPQPEVASTSILQEILGDDIFQAAFNGDTNAQNIIATAAAKIASGQ